MTAPIFEEWMQVPSMVGTMKKSKIVRMRNEFMEGMPQMQPLADAIFSAFAARCSTQAAQLPAA